MIREWTSVHSFCEIDYYKQFRDHSDVRKAGGKYEQTR